MGGVEGRNLCTSRKAWRQSLSERIYTNNYSSGIILFGQTS